MAVSTLDKQIANGRQSARGHREPVVSQLFAPDRIPLTHNLRNLADDEIRVIEEPDQ